MNGQLPVPDRVARLEDQLRVISGTLRAFAEATMDYERLLEVVALRLAEVVQDGCVVRLLGEGGWLHPVAIHLPLEQRVENLAAIERVRAHVIAPHKLDEQVSARRVIESGDALLVPHFDVQQLRSAATPEVVSAYETIGIHSLLIVALRVRGESIGLLSLVRFAPTSPAFTEQDRDLAQALADHAALAITNARLLQTAVRELAERERTEEALRRTEDQLRHAQKMEAIGRLAGGVAHDFNNLLSVILGHGTFLLDDLKGQDALAAEVHAIMKAGQRATELTQQLLAFSRQQVLAQRVIDLNALVREAETMLRRVLGAQVSMTVHEAHDLGPIKADAGQMSQVIMNLALNARDAMPSGGKLTIETRNVELDETYAASHVGVTPGPHVLLAVSDSGIGMDEATRARLFEPFFTTKLPGEGTGLGLATVFGIVRQSEGSIWVYSELGVGTTFKVYLPRASGSAAPAIDVARSAALTGSETILLVEDQDEVRHVATRVLRRWGYEVLEARNSAEALSLALADGRSPRPDLLLSDVVMPGMSGAELAERLQARHPNLKVLFMSGYAEHTVLRPGMLSRDSEFVQKPLIPALLARRVRDVLDASPRSPRSPRPAGA